MKRLPILVLLCVFALGAAWYAYVALSSDGDDTGDAPAAQTVLTPADELTLANLACGGHASVDAKKAVSCTVCPAASDFAGAAPGGGWSSDGILTGSFTAPGEDEALMHASGCESHAKNMGGDFLFRRSGGKWSLVRYASGAPANGDCLKALWGNGRDAVICQVQDMHQGTASNAVQLMTFDAAGPAKTETADYRKVNFVIAYDSSANCGFGSSPTAQFDKVDRVYLIPTINNRPSLTVKVTLARAKEAPGAKDCPVAQPQSYTVNWKNRGDHFEAADGFVALAAKGEDSCCELTVTQRVEPAKY